MQGLISHYNFAKPSFSNYIGLIHGTYLHTHTHKNSIKANSVPVWVKLGKLHPVLWIALIGLHYILNFFYIHFIAGKDLVQDLDELLQGLWLQYFCVIHTTKLS